VDKDFVITAIFMILSSMQPTPGHDHRNSLTSEPVAMQAKHSYSTHQRIHAQRIHEKQGCGSFVFYG